MKKRLAIAFKKPDPEMLKQRKAETKPAKEDKRRKKKNSQSKDPDAPRRPTTAFFIFMEDFRKYFKAQFPENKSAAIVVRAGGDKWKTMSDSEKAPYTEKALKKKAEYEKAVQEYKTKKLNGNANTERSDESVKSSSEVHDEAEEEFSS